MSKIFLHSVDNQIDINVEKVDENNVILVIFRQYSLMVVFVGEQKLLICLIERSESFRIKKKKITI